MFKVNNKHTRTTGAFIVNFNLFNFIVPTVSVVNFEQVNAHWEDSIIAGIYDINLKTTEYGVFAAPEKNGTAA